MIYEKLDKESGAILFKKDHESLKMEEVYKEMVELRKEVKRLREEVKRLQDNSSK